MAADILLLSRHPPCRLATTRKQHLELSRDNRAKNSTMISAIRSAATGITTDCSFPLPEALDYRSRRRGVIVVARRHQEDVEIGCLGQFAPSTSPTTPTHHRAEEFRKAKDRSRTACRPKKRALRRAPRPTISSGFYAALSGPQQSPTCLGEFGGRAVFEFQRMRWSSSASQKLSPHCLRNEAAGGRTPATSDFHPGRRRRSGAPPIAVETIEGDERHRRFCPQAVTEFTLPLQGRVRFPSPRNQEQRAAALSKAAAPWQHAAVLAQPRDMA